MITFEIDRIPYQAIIKKLECVGNKAPEALKKAVNDTARQARKRLVSNARETYTVKGGKVNKTMKIKRATLRSPEAVITAEGRVLSLIDFSTRKNSGRSAAKAQILRSGKMKKLTLGKADRNDKDLKAFIAVMSNGHIGVFQRKPDCYMKGKSPRTLKNGRRTQGREALKQFSGNSVPKMLEKRVYENVKHDIYADLNLYLNKHVSKMMEG